jgi:hypothetical protein
MNLAQLTISIFPLLGTLLLVFAAGFFLRSAQLKDFRKKILDLEKEMLSNHAEILDLQKEKAYLLRQTKESEIPVIPMSAPAEEQDQNFSERKLGASRNNLS